MGLCILHYNKLKNRINNVREVAFRKKIKGILKGNATLSFKIILRLFRFLASTQSLLDGNGSKL